MGDPTNLNEVLTEIVVDFGTLIDTDGSNQADQWQLDPADLAAILALPEVTAVSLPDGTSVLTITLNGTTQTFSGVLTMTTPNDSDVDLDGVSVTVAAEDTSVGTTASGTSTSDITADAIVDGSEVFRNGQVITDANDDVGTNVDTPVNLGLSLALGFDSTDLANGDAPVQGDTDGSDEGDVTEDVIQVTLQLDQGATLDVSLLNPQPTVEDQGGGVTLYTFANKESFDDVGWGPGNTGAGNMRFDWDDTTRGGIWAGSLPPSSSRPPANETTPCIPANRSGPELNNSSFSNSLSSQVRAGSSSGST